MQSTDKRIVRIAAWFICAAVIMLLAWYSGAISRVYLDMKIDECLDSGGAWDYANNVCVRDVVTTQTHRDD
jgi:hypothetical protein